MKKERIEWLLAQNEGQYIEFKQSVSDSVGRAICAFANSGGGTVILGARPKSPVIGISDPSGEEARVQNIAHSCIPPVHVAVSHHFHAQKSLMIVEIPGNQDPPHSFGSTFFMRVGASSQSMDRDEIVDFLYATGQVKYEERLCREFRYPADFNVRAFHRYLKQAGITAAKDRVDTLVNLGIATRSGGKILFKNAGVLFFAKQPKRFLRHGYVDCVLFQGNEKVTVLDRKEQAGNIINNVEEAMVFLRKHLSVRYQIEGLYRKEILELPPEALREALLNAVIHRDYHFDTAWISVEVYKDRVEISSPGGLPPGLKPEEFGTKSVHRNRLIAEMFQRIGEVERVGAGIRKMRDAVKAAGLRPPRFKFTTFFTITFWRPEAQAGARVGAQDDTQTRARIRDDELARKVLVYCEVPRRSSEILKSAGLKMRTGTFIRTMKFLLGSGLLRYLLPDKPRSGKQRYVITEKGKDVLEVKE